MPKKIVTSVGENRKEIKENKKKTIERLVKFKKDRMELSADTVKRVRKTERAIEKEKELKEQGKEVELKVRKIASKFVQGKLTLDDKEQANLLRKMINVDAAKKFNMTPKRTLQEYFFIALANLEDYVDWDSSGELILKAKDELSREQMAAIREINTRREASTGKVFVTKLKFHDKLTALQDIAKHFGLFEKDNSQKAPQLDVDRILNSLPGELNEMVRVKLAKDLAVYAEQQDRDGRGLFGDSDEGSETIN